MSQSDFSHPPGLSDYEEEMLKRLEARYSLPAEEESPFRGFPVHRAGLIRGTHFLAYLNEVQFRSLLPSFPEELTDAPLLFYSEKNRFLPVCRSLMLDWHQELDRIAELLLEAENGTDHDLELETFGLRIREDCYIIGYPGGAGSPIFATKDLLLSILEFAAESGRTAIHLPVSGSASTFRQTYDRALLFLKELRQTIPRP